MNRLTTIFINKTFREVFTPFAFGREGSYIFEQIIEGFRKLELRNKKIANWYYVKLYSDL